MVNDSLFYRKARASAQDYFCETYEIYVTSNRSDYTRGVLIGATNAFLALGVLFQNDIDHIKAMVNLKLSKQVDSGNNDRKQFYQNDTRTCPF